MYKVTYSGQRMNEPIDTSRVFHMEIIGIFSSWENAMTAIKIDLEKQKLSSKPVEMNQGDPFLKGASEDIGGVLVSVFYPVDGPNPWMHGYEVSRV